MAEALDQQRVEELFRMLTELFDRLPDEKPVHLKIPGGALGASPVHWPLRRPCHGRGYHGAPGCLAPPRCPPVQRPIGFWNWDVCS